MLFERVSALLPDGVHSDQYVATEGAHICYVGPERPKGEFGECIDGQGMLLLPGFVNAHSHTAMTLMRGYGENLTLLDWLQQRIFPFEAQMTPDDIYWASLLGIAEMVRYGITSTTDMYMRLPAIARAVMESGVKINLSNGVTNFDGTPYADIAAVHESHDAQRDFHGAADGRVLIDLSLHAEYTSDVQTVRGLAEDAKARGLRMHVHVSETRQEHDACKARHGKTPVRFLYDLGVFDVPTTAAHCVFIEPEDFDILKEKGVTIATCPVSNLKLASGVFDARQALQKGVAFAIGTDSVASNNNLNMLEDLRIFLLAQKGFSGDPTLITPHQAFVAATRAGALAQGRADTGEITVGNRADLCLLDMRGPWAKPVHSLLNNAAYASSGSDIVMTVCDGRVVYRNGAFPTIDIERVMHEVERITSRIVGK